MAKGKGTKKNRGPKTGGIISGLVGLMIVRTLLGGVLGTIFSFALIGKMFKGAGIGYGMGGLIGAFITIAILRTIMGGAQSGSLLSISSPVLGTQSAGSQSTWGTQPINF